VHPEGVIEKTRVTHSSRVVVSAARDVT